MRNYALALLAAAGVGAMIPGMIDVTMNPIVRAGGAVALFVLVYLVRPAELVVEPRKRAHEGKPLHKCKVYCGAFVNCDLDDSPEQYT